MTRVLRTLGVAAVLVLLAGLLGVGAASADETEPDPMAGAPSVGACYDLTLKQAYDHASTKAPVTCSRRSTMFVTAVGEVPASFDWATVDWDKLPAALGKAVTATCDPATTKLLGPEQRRAFTLYQRYWFSPTPAEIEAGARWFSCEVALSESTRLVPLPAGGPTKIGKKIPHGIARCAKAAKGGFRTVACSRPHQWRTTYTKMVRGKLTEKSALKAARQTCPRHMASDDWLYATNWVSARSFVVACSDKTRR